MLPYIADITWIIIQQKSITIHGRYAESDSENSRCPTAKRAVSSQIFPDQGWPEKMNKAYPALVLCSHFISSMAYISKALYIKIETVMLENSLTLKKFSEFIIIFVFYPSINSLLQYSLYSREIINCETYKK